MCTSMGEDRKPPLNLPEREGLEVFTFNHAINVKMPTINIYEQDKFRAQLS